MYLLNNEVDKTYLKWHFILISNMAQEEVRYGSMVYCPTGWHFTQKCPTGYQK
jgi:hypothetical protein